VTNDLHYSLKSINRFLKPRVKKTR
jgi:hypothetical protein